MSTKPGEAQKRVFPLVANAAIGWKVGTNYPSTSYLSAIGWLRHLLAAGSAKGQPGVDARAAIQQFIAVADKQVDHDEQATHIASLSQGVAYLSMDDKTARWGTLLDFDGDVFFEDSVRSEKESPVKDPAQRDAVASALRGLYKAAGGKAPSPFYVVLKMDGDSMGKLLAENPSRQQDIASALAAFSQQVQAKVVEHDGVLVFTGGDDVFALLALDKALHCAGALRTLYTECFQQEASGLVGTISAALIYAHRSSPLQAVLRDAASLLEDIAKHEIGRDAFAIRVWKRGGPILTLAKPWGGTVDWQQEILAMQDSVVRGDYSSRFFYRLRDLFEILDPDEGENVLAAKEEVDILAAEYMKSRERTVDITTARDRCRRLLALCREEWREGGAIKTGSVRADGGLFLRFLDQKEFRE